MNLKETREKIREILIDFRESYRLPFDERVEALKDALAALAAEGVVIEAEDPTLPDNPYLPPKFENYDTRIPIHVKAQQDMLKAGFKRVYPLTGSPSEPADPDAGLELRPEVVKMLKENAKLPREDFLTREQIEPAKKEK